MLRKLIQFNKGGLGVIFKGGKKIHQIRIFAFGHSQVLQKLIQFLSSLESEFERVYSKRVYGLGLGLRSRPSAMTRIPGKSFSPQYPKLLHGPLNLGSEIFSGDISNTENKHAPPYAVAENSLNFDS